MANHKMIENLAVALSSITKLYFKNNKRSIT